MPRTLLHAPGHHRSRSLGWLAVEWIEHLVRHGPGNVQGQPIKHGDEFALYIVDCYALDEHGKMLYDSSFFSRPKGCNKSGLAAQLALFEALGPCRFDGFARGGEVYRDPWGLGFTHVYEAGEPMGRPVVAPMLRVMATEIGQTGNVYATIHYNLTDSDCPLSYVPGIDPGLEQVGLPFGGKIRTSTASAASKDGGLETFVVFDEALSLDTMLPTMDGWTSMGDVQVGDVLIGADGQPAKVMKVTETMTDRECFKVTFRDGTHIVASGGHLWQTRISGSAALPKIRTTEQMFAHHRAMMVPRSRPWDLPFQDLDIDPYILGLWLGDGDSRNATITAGHQDLDAICEQIEATGYTTNRLSPAAGHAPVLYVSLPGSHRNRFSPVRGLLPRLKDAGLIGNKHIPVEYLRGSIDQRTALVQGLMDADGHATPGGHCCFVNSSRPIIDGILELLRSLGENPVETFIKDVRSRVGGYWKITFTPRNAMPFRLPRKAQRCSVNRGRLDDQWVGIACIEVVDPVPVKCVAVDNDDHLFVAGVGGKVTHNTHVYNSPELREMYKVVKRNLRKRTKFEDTWYIETTTMFAPGENSVAEGTYGEAEALREGRKLQGRHRLLYDHRWGDCKVLSQTDALRAAIADAFGEALGWNDIEGILDEFYDTRSDPASSRRYFLNAQTSTSDAWVAAHEWDACARAGKQLAKNDLVCLGMDGSVFEDATALVACRISDGHLQLLGCWEKPEGPIGEGWQVDREAVDAAVAQAMSFYDVAGMFCDPAHWQDYVDRWSNEYGSDMRIRASERRPLEWWTNRPRPMVAALERFHEAVLEERLSFTDPRDRIGEDAELTLTLRRHALNARRRPSRAGMQIGKDYHHSPRRIDSLMAAVLAYEARNEAVAAGIKPYTEEVYAARRIR